MILLLISGYKEILPTAPVNLVNAKIASFTSSIVILRHVSNELRKICSATHTVGVSPLKIGISGTPHAAMKSSIVFTTATIFLCVYKS